MIWEFSMTAIKLEQPLLFYWKTHGPPEKLALQQSYASLTPMLNPFLLRDTENDQEITAEDSDPHQ